MPAIESKIIPKHAYRFVLRRYDKAANRSMKVQGYAEVVNSRAIEMNGKVAQTIFVRTPELRDRCMKAKFGAWRDETAAWFKYLASLGPELPDGDERAFYDFLRNNGPTQRSGILNGLCWDHKRFKLVLAQLVAKELVRVVGSGPRTKYQAVEVE